MSPQQVLCEECGYDLDALRDAAEACPECGEPLSASAPERRTGSPWQSGAGIRTWMRTLRRLLASPRTLFRELRIEARLSRRLLITNITLASLICTGAILAGGPYGLAARPTYAVEFFLIGIALLGFLSGIEIFGIRFFGRRRGWRTDLVIATTVCGHASYGWLVSAVLIAFVWQWQQWCRVLDQWASGWDSPVLPSQLTPFLLGLAFFVGMIVFETYVYLGFRACRFANRDASE